MHPNFTLSARIALRGQPLFVYLPLPFYTVSIVTRRVKFWQSAMHTKTQTVH